MRLSLNLQALFACGQLFTGFQQATCIQAIPYMSLVRVKPVYKWPWADNIWKWQIDAGKGNLAWHDAAQCIPTLHSFLHAHAQHQHLGPSQLQTPWVIVCCTAAFVTVTQGQHKCA